MSKKVIVPLSEIDKLITGTDSENNSYAGVGFRYRLKSADNDQVSEWSPMQIAQFENSSGSNITLAQSNGYSYWAPSRASSQNAYPKTPGGSNKFMPSQIDQIISQTVANTTDVHLPGQDSYSYSWSPPKNFNVKNIDVFTSWRIFSYVATLAAISTPTTVTPPAPDPVYYTGQIRLSGGASTNSAITLKSLVEYLGSGVIKLYAAPITATLGASLSITSNSTVENNIFNISSTATWTGGLTPFASPYTNNLRNVSRTHNWTDFEYMGTTSSNSFNFDRKMTTNKLSAIIKQGENIIRLNDGSGITKFCYRAGVVPGMSLQKISGDGEFASSARITQVDYMEDTILVSELQQDGTIVSTTGTIGSVSSSGGIWTATITGMSGTSPLFVGAIISATPGSPGRLASNNTYVTSVGTTSITIDSTSSIVAGAITDIRVGFKTSPSKSHTASGYIEFVAQSELVASTTHDGTNPIEQYWYKPLLVQAMANASVSKTANIGDTHPYPYALLSISEAQSTYFDGYGTVSARTASAPFTATLSGMNLPYSSNSWNVGATVYALAGSVSGGTLPTGTVSLGGGQARIADYLTEVSVTLNSTAVMNNGVITSIRL
jgi:hypothetical protein